MAKKTDKKHHEDTTRKGGVSIDTELTRESEVTSSGEGTTKGTARGAETPEQAIEKDAEPGASGSAETIRQLEEKIAALNEKNLRLIAEYDNYRKRTAREMETIVNIASEKLIQEFLPILDNLDRATEHRNSSTSYEDYVKGIALIEDQLRRVLAQAGLQRLEVVGERFDPEMHSAVLQADSKEHEPGIIIAEVEKGYTLNGKIIRHPKVVVSR